MQAGRLKPTRTSADTHSATMNTLRTRLALVGITTLTLAAGCAGMRQRAYIRQGHMTRGLIQSSFERVWGLPPHTAIEPCAQASGASASWGGGGGSFQMHRGGKTSCEIWYYPEHNLVLGFSGHRLSYWRSLDAPTGPATR